MRSVSSVPTGTTSIVAITSVSSTPSSSDKPCEDVVIHFVNLRHNVQACFGGDIVTRKNISLSWSIYLGPVYQGDVDICTPLSIWPCSR